MVESVHYTEDADRVEERVAVRLAEGADLENGETALQFIRKEHYDLIFMDHMMPVMDGIEAMKIIRGDHLCDDTPVIMLTANTVNGISETYFRAGFADYLTKPFTLKTIRKTVIKFLPVDEDLINRSDWEEEWKQLQTAREHFDDPAVWDARAKTFPVKHGSQQGYVEQFLERAALKPGESVLDMGCGTGALATPLAQSGHPVIACDFSRGMLRMLEDDMSELGVGGVDIHVMSWDDNWNEHGIGENCVDVAFASRSIATYDLRHALEKLTRVARRRVCITLPASLSPKSDDKLL